ncbi:MAG: helix-turn-helix domain-containing protein [Streptosporangiales bacterium]|nr:helix-turn-helix domain-containing protein [Streptosporangiales bacterium]
MERRSLSAIAALADDLRRNLYSFIRRAGRPVTREEAAEKVGISRKLAAFHLDKLVHVGLLKAGQEPPGRRARRPGRSPKVYEPSDLEIRVSIPERRYDLVGDILVDAVAQGEADAREAAMRIARERGADLGSRMRAKTTGGRAEAERPFGDVPAILERLGYEPFRDDGVVLLRNCPFHHLVERQRELVCGINRCFLDGLLQGLADDATRTAAVPGDSYCCVQLHARGR